MNYSTQRDLPGYGDAATWGGKRPAEDDESYEDESYEDETPEDETPEDETPEDETPEDETPEAPGYEDEPTDSDAYANLPSCFWKEIP